MALLEVARKEAKTLFEEDPQLENPEHEILGQQVEVLWQQAGDIS